MRKKVKTTQQQSVPLPESSLTRVLEGLEGELVEASDEDIHEAACDLGMNLSMKGSAAFIGLKWPIGRTPRLEDFFDLSGFGPRELEALRHAYEERLRGADDSVWGMKNYLPRKPEEPDET